MNQTNKIDITLLYIEDEEMIRTELEQFLSGKVRELICAENGLEGLELYRQKRPDIILTDVMMPKMDGLTMVKQLKEEFGEIPVIIMTAFNESDTKMEDINVRHVDKVLSKPIRTRKVIEALREVVEKRGL